MIRNVNGKKGFTLIELMIVVAIIGILAAIAIPNFVAMQLRSKRSELPTNVDAARTAEKAYEHEWDVFTACSARPTSVPTKTQVAFGQAFGDGSDWDLLGWMPDGLVRAQYVISVNTGTSVSQNFSAQAYADIDGDGTQSKYTADKNVKASMVSLNSQY
jgi:type IV pilus assembly protein PilA